MPGEKEGHEVVISGISGLFPESEDVNELWSRLLNKEDMITVDDRRWIPGEFDVPSGTGKIRHPGKFDMAFFGVNRRMCEKMDPYVRLECEQAYRAVCDAGVNPSALDGTNTAVVTSCFMSEPENDLASGMMNMGMYNVLSVSRCMQANRISFYMNLTGPSYTVDCDGYGGFLAIQHACDLIANGYCAAAIVGSGSLFHKPESSFHFKAMGRLSEDGATRSFSADASGYARSEACVTMFLQRKDQAKRIYATILAVDAFTLGSKADQFCEFPINRYEETLKEIYKQAKVNPKDVSYVEGNGAASRKLDAFELNALSKFMLPGRKEPLLIGSVKSNLGHTEGASSMVSLIKVLLAMDRGVIPPNINYSKPNPDVPDLVSGKIQVVTEPTPVPGDIIAVSEIGFNGICSHMIVKRWEKTSQTSITSPATPELPFLLTMSGRNEDALKENMKNLEKEGVDANLTILINGLYKDGIKSHLYRGCSIISKGFDACNMTGPAPGGEKMPVWFMYSGMGSQWPTMAKSLMGLPIFARAIQKCHDILFPKGINLIDIVTKDKLNIFDGILNCFVGIAAVQIGLTDVLRAVGVEPDGIIGHSVGELGCAYADGCLTDEQMILAAYARGRASVESTLIKGMMAAVGAGYKTMKSRVPQSIDIACHNSEDSCTLSGPTDDMNAYVSQLKTSGMFAKSVNVANIAYHSRYIKPAAPALLKYLKEIIPDPKKRSSKWVSSSNQESDWDTALAQYCSAEYHTNNLLSAVLFEEASAHIPPNAIVLEIAPHGLLQAIVKKSLPEATHIPLTNKFHPSNLTYFIGALGKMYLSGISVNIESLYSQAQYPVPRGIAAISPLLDWLEGENFCIRRKMIDPDYPSSICRFVTVKKGNAVYEKVAPHKLYGRTVLPFSFYFNNIIDLYTSHSRNTNKPMLIGDFGVFSSTEMSPDSTKEIRFHMLAGTGNVEVSDYDNDSEVVSYATIDVTYAAAVRDLVAVSQSEGQTLIPRVDMMEFMKSMGIERDAFINVDSIVMDETGVTGVAQWTGNLGDFVASLLSLVEFYVTKRDNVLKLFYRSADMRVNLPLLQKLSTATYVAKYSDSNKTLECEGVRISLIECRIPSTRPVAVEEADVLFDYPKFIPYHNEVSLSVKDFVDVCTQLVLENTENTPSTLMKIMEVGGDSDLLAALRQVASSKKYSAKTHLTDFSSDESFLKLGVPALFQKDVWLVFEYPPSQEVLKYLEIFKNGFVLLPSNTTNLLSNPVMRVIFESCVSNKRYSLLSTHNNYTTKDLEVVSLNEAFLSNLQFQLENVNHIDGSYEAKKRVILMGEVDSFISVESIVEQTEDLPNHQGLQFWFFVGTTLSSHSEEQFKRQLERRVKINVCIGGVWGSVRLFPVQVVDRNSETERGSTFHHPFSAVFQSGGLQAIGLNLPDSLNESTYGCLSVYDYVTHKSMGIGTYDPHVKKFNPHKSLSWKKPSHWTPAESATVPYYYSLASYIINHVNFDDLVKQRTILINRGLMPLSQALIAIALYSKLTVYVSVYGENEKHQLLELFPNLEKDKILDCSTSAFFVEVLRKTKGINKVINNFETDHMIESCAKCVSSWGVIVYTNLALLERGAKMGMFVFHRGVFAIYVSTSFIWECSDVVNEEIKKNVEGAIRAGVVKPITSVSTLPLSVVSSDAVGIMKSVPNSKVIVNPLDRLPNERMKVYFQNEMNHVILEGKAPGGLSLNIAEWLLKRGCRKIVVFTRQIRPLAATSLRIQCLQNHYKKAEVQVKPISHLSSRSNIDTFVEDMPKRPFMVFALGSGIKDKVENFNIVLTERGSSEVVFIGSEFETVCEQRRKNNLPTLYVRCSTATMGKINPIQYLDSFMQQSKNEPIVFISKCPAQTRAGSSLVTDLGHIPDSLEELHQLLHQCPPNAKFVELRTNSPRHQMNREVYPVFMIPGFRPEQLRQLASRLFSPAFEARLPAEIHDLKKEAGVLTEQLLSMPQNMFTIVAESWGGVLALDIASKLEKHSKTVCIIFLNASPTAVRKWTAELLDNDVALIGKYMRISPKDNVRMSNLSWDSKVKLAIENSGISHEEDKKVAEECLNLLNSRLKCVRDLEPPFEKLVSKCHVLKLSSRSEEDHGLQQYLKQEPIIHFKDAASVSDMIGSEASDEVNTLHLFEYTDAANPPVDEYMGLNVVKKPGWYSSLLYRVIE